MGEVGVAFDSMCSFDLIHGNGPKRHFSSGPKWRGIPQIIGSALKDSSMHSHYIVAN